MIVGELVYTEKKMYANVEVASTPPNGEVRSNLLLSPLYNYTNQFIV